MSRFYYTYRVTETYKNKNELNKKGTVTNFPFASIDEAYAKFNHLLDYNKQFTELYFDYELCEIVWDWDTDELVDINLLERKVVTNL